MELAVSIKPSTGRYSKTDLLRDIPEVKNPRTIKKVKELAKETAPVKKLSKVKINLLITEHYELGQKLAWSMLSNWRIRLPKDDVDSSVGLALCDAAHRFDPSRGVSFKTFLFYHLRGVLLKEVTAKVQNGKTIYRSINDADLFESESDKLPEWDLKCVDDLDPEKIMSNREMANWFSKALDQLDPLQKTVVMRSLINDEQINSLAKELGYCRCHLSRVKTQAIEIIKNSLAMMNEEGEDSTNKLLNSLKPTVYRGGRGRRK